jgi:hypothetical protein
MHDNHCGNDQRRDAWRFERQAKRAAWRARRAARHAGRGDWAHLKDPKFWGLDPESMKAWGMGSGMNSGMGSGMGTSESSSEVAALKAQVAEMEKTMAAMNQRIIVLEKLMTDDEARISREIDRLRDKPDGGK